VDGAVRMIPPWGSPRVHARVAVAVLFVAVVVCWLGAGIDWNNYQVRAHQAAGGLVGTPEERTATVLRKLLAGGQLALLVATAAAFIVWLQRCRTNLRALGARRMDYRTGWSVAAFLVPVLHLVLPYLVVSEVWRASQPGVRDPFAWKDERASLLVPAWWLTLVSYVALELGPFAMGMGRELTPLRLQLVNGLALLGDVAGGISGSLGILLVLRLTRAQIEKHQRVRKDEIRAAAGG